MIYKSKTKSRIELIFFFLAGSAGCLLLWMSQWFRLFSDLWFRKL